MKIEPNTGPLQILVIGGNGGIGRKCIEIALLQGHFVTAILRTPAKLGFAHPHLQIVKGDISDAASIASYIANKDAVISAVGVSGGIGSDKPTTLYSRAAETVLAEINKTNKTRAFFISASALDVSPVNSFIIRFLTRYVIQRLLKHMYEDLRKMEKIIKASDANWTVIRPPQLTDKAETGEYRVAVNAFLKDCTKISRADVAHFIINNINNEAIFKSTIEIAY